MILKKINAVLGLVNTVLVLDHSIFYTVWMLYRGKIAKSAPQLPWFLVALVVLHALLSIVSALRAHENKQAKVRMYNRWNIPTVLQRFSGIAMVLFLVLHLVGSATYFQPSWLHAALHPLFFIIVLLHTAVSASKSMISLGIGTAKIIRIVDVIMIAVCLSVAVVSIFGFYLCLFGGVGA